MARPRLPYGPKSLLFLSTTDCLIRKRTFWPGFQKVPVLSAGDQYVTPAGRAAAEKYPCIAPDDRPGVSMARSLVEPMASILSVSTEIMPEIRPVHRRFVRAARQQTRPACSVHHLSACEYPCAPAGCNYRCRVVLVNPQQWFKTQTVRVIIEVVERVADGRVIRRGGIGAPGSLVKGV